MNEFFRCPSYTYGLFVISILLMVLGLLAYTVMGSAAYKPLMVLGAVVGFSWLLWVLYNFFYRDADCERVGNFNGSFKNPFVDMF
jgi:uncharacterized membrane-anchored protein